MIAESFGFRGSGCCSTGADPIEEKAPSSGDVVSGSCDLSGSRTLEERLQYTFGGCLNVEKGIMNIPVENKNNEIKEENETIKENISKEKENNEYGNERHATSDIYTSLIATPRNNNMMKHAKKLEPGHSDIASTRSVTKYTKLPELDLGVNFRDKSCVKRSVKIPDGIHELKYRTKHISKSTAHETCHDTKVTLGPVVKICELENTPEKSKNNDNDTENKKRNKRKVSELHENIKDKMEKGNKRLKIEENGILKRKENENENFEEKEKRWNDENIEQVKVLTISEINVTYSKRYILDRYDNYVHFFLSTDCKVNSILGKDMLEMNLINQNIIDRDKPWNVGEIMETKTKIGNDEYHVLSIFIKDNENDEITLENLIISIYNLKNLVIAHGINSFSVSKNEDNIDDLTWPNIDSTIREIFKNTEIIITICTNELIYPDKSIIPDIIAENHNSRTAGHKGFKKTFDRIKETYYWPRMRTDILKFVKSCDKCQRIKLVRRKTKLPMKITNTPKEAFETVEMDIVGPLPVTESNNKYILTIHDRLSKYSLAIPLPNTETERIAEAFAEEFICRFGCPKEIVTDQGSNFQSGMMKTFCKLFKIKKFKSSAYHPQSMGSIERHHMTLIEYLKSFSDDTQWDKLLRYATFSYNTSVHTATQLTPHEIVFGKKARLPSAYTQNTISLTYNNILNEIVNRIINMQKIARERIILAKEKSKRYYDQKLNNKTFKEGDYVFLLKPPNIGKLEGQYAGKYKIITLIGDRNAKISLGQGRTKIVHLDRLKHAYHRDGF